MSKHSVVVSWTSNGDFAAGHYSRAHEWHFDGGAVIPASSSPEVVAPPLSDPAAVDPEEALIAAVSSCHMLWFLALARSAGFVIDGYRDEAEGEMGRIAPGRIALTRIVLRPEIAFSGAPPAKEELDRLHHEAHEKCFIANSLKTEVVVEALEG